MKNVQGRKKLCGSGELGEIHADGANEMRVEFISNRRSQSDGFEYYITCIDPGFDGNAVRSGAVADATPVQIREAAQCTSPSRERRSTTSQDNPLVGIHNLIIVAWDECLIYPIVHVVEPAEDQHNYSEIDSTLTRCMFINPLNCSLRN